MRLCTPPDGKPCFQCSMTVCSYSLLCPARRNSHSSPPARQFDTVETSWHYRHKPLSHLNPILSNPPADFSRHERELCFTKQREVARRYSVYAWRRALRDIDVGIMDSVGHETKNFERCKAILVSRGFRVSREYFANVSDAARVGLDGHHCKIRFLRPLLDVPT
jgi:hypothetical protein